MIQAKPEVIPVFSGMPGIRAFFTTRNGGHSQGSLGTLNLSFFTGDEPATVRKNWSEVLASQQLSHLSLALPRLCHGSRLEEIAGPPPPREDTVSAAPTETDAVFTRSGEWALAVTLGDCLAALIADPVTRCVAVVHAGWRGTRDNILGKTLDRLFAEGHCRPDSTRVAFGPCLSQDALGVSPDAAATLPSRHVREKDGAHFFDLTGCNRSQAETAGARHFEETGGCTRTDVRRFFSYRRDGAASGRMAACIALL